MKKTLIILLACLLVIGNIAFPVFAETAEEETGFTLRNGIKFGDSIEDVKSKETFAIDEDSSTIADDGSITWLETEEGTISGYDGYVSFHFGEDSCLDEMKYHFSETTLKDSCQSRFDTLRDGLTRKYGTPLGNYGGNCYVITTSAIDGAVLMYTLIDMMDGVGDYLDYDEWIVDIGKDEHVKIDMIAYYYGTSYSDLTYYLDIAYKYFTDDDLLNKQQEKQEQQDAVDNDL